jgi:hypothetical protein
MNARPVLRIVNTGAACHAELHELCEHSWCDCSCHATSTPLDSIVARYSSQIVESRAVVLEAACRFALEAGAGVAAIDDPGRSSLVAYVTTRIPAGEIHHFPTHEAFTDWLNS